MNKLVLMSFALVYLAGCGGGGGDAPSESSPPDDSIVDESGGDTPSEPEQPQTDPYVKRSITIEEPSSYRPFTETNTSVCDEPVLQFAIPVDLNQDSLEDFIIHYWCGNPTTQEEYTRLTPDALVAQVSDGEGNYTVANASVFGVEYIQLGGASRKFRRADINGDGYDDFAFAMNSEDGRPDIEGVFNVAARPAILLSGGPNENGIVQYRVVKVGELSWGHGVGIIKNEDGTRDVAFAGYTNVSRQVFRYTDSGFVDVSDIYQGDSDWPNHFEPLNSNGVTRFIASNNGYGSSGVVLHEKVGDSLVQVGSYEVPVDFTVNLYGYPSSVVNVNGKQYIGGAFFTMCQMPAFSAETGDVLVANLSTTQLVDGTSPVENGNYPEDGALETVNFLLFFEYDSTGLRRIPNPLVGEESRINYNFIYCKDVNNDGLTDLVTSPFSRSYDRSRLEEDGRPDFYLNQGDGSLVLQDLSYLPGYSGDETIQSTRGKLVELDNDGVTDLMIFGDTTGNGAGAIEIHLLK